MKCTLSTQAYKWRSRDGWNVGKLVETSPDFALTQFGSPHLNDIDEDDSVQVAHSHTSELEFVRWGDLSAYGPPGEPAMPQPESKETVK